jgi:hypothetical protein
MKKMKTVKMTIIRRLHLLVVNLNENVEIVVQPGIKQRIANQKQTKMAVRIAEITEIFRMIQVMALIALIVIVQVILKEIVTNRKINRTVTVVQITMAVNEKKILIPKMLRSH